MSRGLRAILPNSYIKVHTTKWWEISNIAWIISGFGDLEIEDGLFDSSNKPTALKFQADFQPKNQIKGVVD